ncbi:hypothetical protein NE237_003378 [Protea cynaroides]|uniref:Rho termination factor N-terminal domain-containing protein n=1 Tax=Protea cynaroides TaxID=273540 RepID=A0A9Q0KGX4_9MAGN|nr:hypothetical protein NE237_003378 [Protea cynaroides]
MTKDYVSLAMDWDLWGPPYNQDSPERSFDRRQHEWKSDFYFGYGTDVIEEDALNEKSCVEVLRKLISKANIEIEGLEEDLVILQTQLEWADQNKLKEWFEICCKDLEEKTFFLEILIQNLKNENLQNECDNDFQSTMHGEPPRRISELVKALLGTHCQSKTEQPEDVAGKDAFRHGTGQSSDKESLSNFESESSITDEIIERSITHADISLNSSVIVKDFSSDAFSPAIDQFDNEKSSNSLSLINITTEEVKESNVPCTNISLNSSMKPDGKLMNHPVTVTAQEAGIFGTDNVIAESSSNLQGHVAKDISMSAAMAVQDPRIPAIDSTVNGNSHLKLQGQITKNEKQFNPVDGHEPRVPPIADVISNLSCNSRGREGQKPGSMSRNNNVNNQKRTKRTVQVTPCGVQEPSVASNNNETSLRPPSKLEVKGRKSTKPSDIAKVKEASDTPTEFLKSEGVTIEGTSKEDLQLSNSSGAQEPGVVNNSSPYDLFPPSKPQVKRKKSTKHLDIAKVKEPSETLQGDTVECPSKEILPISCAVQGPGVVGDYSHDHLCPSLEPQVKKSTQPSDIAMTKEPSAIPTEFWTLQGGTIESPSKEDIHLSNSCKAQEAGVVGDNRNDNLNPLSKSRAKRSNNTNLPSRGSNEPIVALEYSTLQGDMIKMKSEKGLEFCKSSVGVESCVASDHIHSDLFLQSKPIAKKRKSVSESLDKVTGPLPTNREDMMKLTLPVLRAYAKLQGLKSLYSKKKPDIVNLLLEGQTG